MKNGVTLEMIFRNWHDQDQRLWNHDILEYIKNTIYDYANDWQAQFLIYFKLNSIEVVKPLYEKFALDIKEHRDSL